jgi:hypothetical protein
MRLATGGEEFRVMETSPQALGLLCRSRWEVNNRIMVYNAFLACFYLKKPLTERGV